MANYVGSPYHKRYPVGAGVGQLRSDKTECPPEIPWEEAREVLTRAIDEALHQGDCIHEENEQWPRLVWGRSEFRSEAGVSTVVWEARLSNRVTGEYHAYPIQQDRHDGAMPPEVRERLWAED